MDEEQMDRMEAKKPSYDYFARRPLRKIVSSSSPMIWADPARHDSGSLPPRDVQVKLPQAWLVHNHEQNSRIQVHPGVLNWELSSQSIVEVSNGICTQLGLNVPEFHSLKCSTESVVVQINDIRIYHRLVRH